MRADYVESDRSTELRRTCRSKSGYWTMTQARTVADKRQAKGAPPLRAYKCPHCPRYHLTKQSVDPVSSSGGPSTISSSKLG